MLTQTCGLALSIQCRSSVNSQDHPYRGPLAIAHFHIEEHGRGTRPRQQPAPLVGRVRLPRALHVGAQVGFESKDGEQFIMFLKLTFIEPQGASHGER
jgi:hypothetical protein